MSPLKANVLINDCINTISITVGKPTVGPSRKLNVYLLGQTDGIKPTKIGEYQATALINCYALVRCFGGELVPVGKCVTLAGCQAVALSDYIQQFGMELIPDEEYD